MLRREIADNIRATEKPPGKNLDPFSPIARTAWDDARVVGFDEHVADAVAAAYRLGAKYNALVARTQANVGERPGGLVGARLDALNLLASVNAAFAAARKAMRPSWAARTILRRRS